MPSSTSSARFRAASPARGSSASANWGLVWSAVALVVGLAMPWADTSLIGEPQSWYLPEVKGLGWLVLVVVRAVHVTGLASVDTRITRTLSIVIASTALLTLVLAEVIGGLGILEVLSVVGDVSGRGEVDIAVGLGPWLVGVFSTMALLPDSTWNGVTLGVFEPRRRMAAWLGLIGIVMMLVARYDSFVSVSAGTMTGGLALARLPLLGPLSLILTMLSLTLLAVGYFRSRACLLATMVLVFIIGVAALIMGVAGNAATRLDSSWVEESIPVQFAEYDPEIVAGHGWLLAVGGVALVMLSAGVGMFASEPLRVKNRRRNSAVPPPPPWAGSALNNPDEATTDPPWGDTSSSKDLDW